MKKLLFTSLICFFTLSSLGQLQFGVIKQDGQTLQNIPRYSWNIPFYKDYVSLDNQDRVLFVNGILLKNGGVIFNRNGDRFKQRAISIGSDIGFLFTIKERLMFMVTAGMDYNFHYKEKIFREEQRKNKEVLVSEWNSNRVTRFVPFTKVAIGFKDSYYIYFEYFLSNLMNTSFNEVVDGNRVYPYRGLEISRFNIGFSYDILSKTMSE